MGLVRELQQWYAAQCDGDWEHEFGIRLETLDNPGWYLTIHLDGTSLEREPYEAQRHERTERDWIWCEVTGGRFEARCGSENLEEALREFLGWAARVDASKTTSGSES